MHIFDKYLVEVCQAKEALQSLDVVWGRYVFDRSSMLGSGPRPSLLIVSPSILFLLEKKSHFTSLTLKPYS